MSDDMLLAVLRMPPTIWGKDELDVYQRYVRYLAAADKIERMTKAINEMQKYNRLKNDRDALIHAWGEYGLREIDEEPIPEEFGFDSEEAK